MMPISLLALKLNMGWKRSRTLGLFSTGTESHDQSVIEAEFIDPLALVADTYVGMTSSDPTEPNDMANIVVLLVG